MSTYFIEPGDWEAATGECLPSGRDGIVVVPLEKVNDMLVVIRRLATVEWMGESELSMWIKKCKEIVRKVDGLNAT
jgi:hypothetical protein